MLFVKDVGKKKRSKFSWILGYRHLAKKNWTKIDLPMVLKLSKQDWVAHSTSLNEIGLVTWRQTVAFPETNKQEINDFLT